MLLEGLGKSPPGNWPPCLQRKALGGGVSPRSVSSSWEGSEGAYIEQGVVGLDGPYGPCQLCERPSHALLLQGAKDRVAGNAPAFPAPVIVFNVLNKRLDTTSLNHLPKAFFSLAVMNYFPQPRLVLKTVKRKQKQTD